MHCLSPGRGALVFIRRRIQGDFISPHSIMSALRFALCVAGLTAVALAVPVDQQAAAQQFRPGVVPAPLPQRQVLPQRIVQPVPLRPYYQGPILGPADQFYNRGQDGQSYTSGYASPDGTRVFMQGDLVPTLDGQDVVVVKRGGYSYISPEGNTINVNYIADHQGFRVIPGDPRVGSRV